MASLQVAVLLADSIDHRIRIVREGQGVEWTAVNDDKVQGGSSIYGSGDHQDDAC